MNGKVLTKPMLHIQIADLDNKKSVGTSQTYDINAGSFSTSDLNITVNNDYSLRKAIMRGRDVILLTAIGRNNDTSMRFDLIFEAESDPFLINKNGLLPMLNNTNSYYYSIPHFKTTGEFTLNGETYQISLRPGDTWMDHQWGDFNVQTNGWEWFSIRLDNGLVGNIFLNVDYQKKGVVDGVASVILPSGEKQFIPYSQMLVTRSNYWYDQRLGVSYPTTFGISIPSLGLTVNNVAAFPDQEVNGYWEGYCSANATYKNQNTNGFSYTELVYLAPGSREVH